MQNDKYIVFKRAEWLQFVEGMEIKDNDMFSQTCPDPLHDAVVIRRQDVFAPPALDAYSNSILVALSLATDDPSKVHEHLKEVADYFHQQAQIAWDTNRKLPD